MKIGICDDQSEMRAYLKKCCCNLGYRDIVMYSSGEELLDSQELTSLHLVFLGIDMKGVDGIEVKERLELFSPTTLVAFCSTHQERMADAFGCNVISFLAKPPAESAIEECIHHAAYWGRDFYSIEISKGDIVACRDIMYLQADQKYTVFHTADGVSHLARKPLKKWVEELGGLGFCPVSRSAVINLKNYGKLIHNGRLVRLHNGEGLSISRHFEGVLRGQLDSYVLHQIRREDFQPGNEEGVCEQ